MTYEAAATKRVVGSLVEPSNKFEVAQMFLEPFARLHSILERHAADPDAGLDDADCEFVEDWNVCSADIISLHHELTAGVLHASAVAVFAGSERAQFVEALDGRPRVLKLSPPELQFVVEVRGLGVQPFDDAARRRVAGLWDSVLAPLWDSSGDRRRHVRLVQFFRFLLAEHPDVVEVLDRVNGVHIGIHGVTLSEAFLEALVPSVGVDVDRCRLALRHCDVEGLVAATLSGELVWSAEVAAVVDAAVGAGVGEGVLALRVAQLVAAGASSVSEAALQVAGSFPSVTAGVLELFGFGRSCLTVDDVVLFDVFDKVSVVDADAVVELFDGLWTVDRLSRLDGVAYSLRAVEVLLDVTGNGAHPDVNGVWPDRLAAHVGRAVGVEGLAALPVDVVERLAATSDGDVCRLLVMSSVVHDSTLQLLDETVAGVVSRAVVLLRLLPGWSSSLVELCATVSCLDVAEV